MSTKISVFKNHADVWRMLKRGYQCRTENIRVQSNMNENCTCTCHVAPGWLSKKWGFPNRKTKTEGHTKRNDLFITARYFEKP